MSKIVFCLLIPVMLFSAEQDPPDFYLVTIPKSGSHLAIKVLEKITQKKCHNISSDTKKKYGFSFPPSAPQQKTNDILDQIFQSNCFPFMHFDYHPILLKYSKSQKHCIPIVNIRDLRDVCISSVHYFKTSIDQILGKNATFDERLSLVIKRNYHSSFFYSPQLMASNAIECIKNESPLVIRFEEIIGKEGGGDQDIQRGAFANIAQHLGYPLNEQMIEDISKNLFGMSKTFRKGKMDQWKFLFTEKHKEEFKNSPLGEMLIELGYETDNNW